MLDTHEVDDIKKAEKALLRLEIEGMIAEATTKLKEEIYSKSFADSDPYGHRRYHEKMIQEHEHVNKVKMDIFSKVAEKVIFFLASAMVLGLGTLAVKYLAH
jgi:hypothetical protein